MPETEQLPPQFNTDISKGPTWSALPAPYQPPVQSGPWDATQFIQAASRELPIAEATKAIESATQLEGVLGYDADIKAGVPTHDALTKWAPKLFFKHPAVALRAAAAQPQFKPSQVEVGGQSLIQMSPNRFSFAPKGPRTELTPSENLNVMKAQMKGLQDQIKNETDPKKEAALWQQHNALVDQLGGLRAKTAAITSGGGGIPPAPKNAKDRQTGMVYMTPKGPHKWTGEHWTVP
jgi:hypothetical protein